VGVEFWDGLAYGFHWNGAMVTAANDVVSVGVNEPDLVVSDISLIERDTQDGPLVE
jgi:hypothetical protein